MKKFLLVLTVLVGFVAKAQNTDDVIVIKMEKKQDSHSWEIVYNDEGIDFPVNDPNIVYIMLFENAYQVWNKNITVKAYKFMEYRELKQFIDLVNILIAKQVEQKKANGGNPNFTKEYEEVARKIVKSMTDILMEKTPNTNGN